MIVKRTVFLNPIEPGMLSFRGGANVDTVLDVTYYAQSGLPISFDVDGQLQLTSRSMKVSKAYSMPATDIANGQARAVIPAGDLSDVNGYQARLYGSVAGEAYVLAAGLVVVDDADAPMPEPVDVVDQVPVLLDRAQTEDTKFTVTLWDDTSKSDPYDLGTSVITAAIFTSNDRTVKLVDFVVTVIATNAVELTLTPAQVAALPDECWWGLRIGAPGGVTTLCEGTVTVIGVAP